MSNMVGTDTFYEQGDDRDDRYRHLVRKLAVEDPEWTARLLGWLRRGGNMRTASLVGAAEYVRARLDAAAPGHSRQSLTVLRAAAELAALPVPDRRAFVLDPSLVTAPGGLAAAGFTWERLAGWLQGPMDKAAWEAAIPSLGLMACLAEGTPVWLADGTTAPIEEVVARKLPVLSYDKAWDARPVKYGPGQEPRDMGVGNLVPTVPTDWLDAGVRSVWEVKFVSGRRMEATRDHRWMTRRRIGRQAWEWKTTLDLEVGDHVPMPLTAGFFGDTGDAWDGYFVGAMLGDGGMTGTTPEFHGNPDDGAVAFMYEYAAKHGCQVTEIPMPGLVRLRITDPRHGRNAVLDVLRDYEVWGKRVEVKSLPNRSFSREFWIGCLSGLIDTDGCVRRRRNKQGYLHGSVEFGVVSRRLAEQVSDALL
ncbi:LAGLIDADG family homing endonuclease, partial [Streptomyces sp. MCAF7]